MGEDGVITAEKGDKVEKVSGYKWPGVIVSVFETLAGETRVVVECTTPEVAGALHIYNLSQLRLVSPIPSAADL
jgi:hypothetical protein